ncbi:hypothetical protein [Aggregatibacter actinomycetemcomitans]|uniref:hypothetical protein n=1 Tax=Aggregatibacter actinomycetemcomitans TaxID=714 RepID=UPI001E64B805|nr:hypothetical protein [Aggregatibacter actinomycetemcomitans]
MKGLKMALMLTALLSGTAVAQTPKCPDNDEVCWQQEATAEWRKEYGDLPPPLTPEEEKEVRQWLREHYPDTDFYKP